MSSPSTQSLNGAFQEFRAALQNHFVAVAGEAGEDKQVMVDRVFAALAALVGAVLLLLPGKFRKDGAASALLATAIRLWSRERKNDATTRKAVVRVLDSSG